MITAVYNLFYPVVLYVFTYAAWICSCVWDEEIQANHRGAETFENT